MEELLQSLILTHKLNHSCHQRQELVNKHELCRKFVHLQRASYDEDVQLLTDYL